jgi:hypothetical protein
MENKKRMTILVTIALILAITAIALSVMDSEVSTTSGESQLTGHAVIEILPPQIEDKLADTTPQ